ncbi:phenylalanine--tRNA ligase subunit beta [Archaeoglobales archaeon]|nr:MAG: phenylalanine--tRNA ligase subunit beta [Archaeoglobales archaeon]
MPVITLYWDELEKMVGKSREEILSKLPMLGCDIERVSDEQIDVEFFPNRPDLYSVEGVARALRGFLDVELGYKHYEVKKADWKIFVDESVLGVRPRIVGCVVRNLKIDDEVIRSLMEVQEDLHWTIGRNRRKMAIGVHDLSKVNFPLCYKGVDKNFSFVPLDFDEVMSVGEILTRHPKGKEYGFILEGKDRFPMIVDSKNEAISFPPIINAEKTRVTEKTTDLFIDVTGFDENVDKALNIISTMLADRGGVLESVEIKYPSKVIQTPDLKAKEMEIDRNEVYALLGFKLTDEEIKKALERMRFGVEIGKIIKVKIPPYRADIMHEWDVIEDIAIGYGYEKIEPEYPPTNTIGSTHPWNEVRDLVKEIMIGLGFMEVITFTLTNERVQYEYLNRKAEGYTEVMHPLTTDHTIVRTDVLPKLLELLSYNKHHLLPQKIFEVGDVVVNDLNRLRVAACITHSKANFNEIRSVVQAFMGELDLKWDVNESDDNAFIEGRRADVIVNGKKIGVFGEIHPEVLEKFELAMPVAAFEVDLTEIFDCGELL